MVHQVSWDQIDKWQIENTKINLLSVNTIYMGPILFIIVPNDAKPLADILLTINLVMNIYWKLNVEKSLNVGAGFPTIAGSGLTNGNTVSAVIPLVRPDPTIVVITWKARFSSLSPVRLPLSGLLLDETICYITFSCLGQWCWIETSSVALLGVMTWSMVSVQGIQM